MHDIHASSGKTVAQHLDPKLGVGCVYRDIDGAYMQVAYALYLTVGKVRHGDIVSQKEAKACVIVLEIHRAAHTLGQLVDKAEHAVVCTAAGLVHEVGLKLKPEILPLGLSHIHGVLQPLGRAHGDADLGVVAEELVVEHINDLLAVYGKQRIADTDAVPQRASVFNFGNHITHLDSFKQKEERDNLSSLSVSITLLPSEPDGHCTYRKPCRHDEAF